MAAQAKPLEGLYLVPAFNGLGAPYWAPKATGLLCGMGRGTGRAEVVRAAEESIAYQIADILFLMQRESGFLTERLRVDGGPHAGHLPHAVPVGHSGARLAVPPGRNLSDGAAYAAGFAWASLPARNAAESGRHPLYPANGAGAPPALYQGWQAAVQLALPGITSRVKGAIRIMSLKLRTAQALGVSMATVSMVLNQKPGISEETAARCWLHRTHDTEKKLTRKRTPPHRGMLDFVIYKKHGKVVSDTPFFSTLIEASRIKPRSAGIIFDLQPPVKEHRSRGLGRG